MLYILGRQPKLGLAELESLAGADNVRPVGDIAAIVENHPIPFRHLGGSIKAGTIIDRLPSVDWPKITKAVETHLKTQLETLPVEGKIKLGLSLYGLDISVPKINASALSLKKVIKRAGRSVRVVPNQDSELSSAQVLHNQLATPLGLEILLVRDDQSVIIALTSDVQNITDYTIRDRERPKRDAFVGMLPPKLAQIMINLAIGQLPTNQLPITDNKVILDPFCGTGVVLQEAALQGYNVYGSDNSVKMIDYSRANLDWLRRTYDITFDDRLELGDATTHQWQSDIDAIVSETYLGQPMSSLPLKEKLDAIIHGCNQLHRKFFTNLAPQLQSGTPLCIAVPAWQTAKGFLHLSMLDDLENLGYNRLDFTCANTSDLIYYREDQIVARELLVLTRK
ncbi:MAG TPA: hypothetical protein VH144_01635 [Candidatus Saccharimonadales bacterium]|jgi:tRNA (guanine10-N2)-dimethyltransferase|nr:hypothetical protein [Candidatus Saccharimonadales bacterium]